MNHGFGFFLPWNIVMNFTWNGGSISLFPQTIWKDASLFTMTGRCRGREGTPKFAANPILKQERVGTMIIADCSYWIMQSGHKLFGFMRAVKPIFFSNFEKNLSLYSLHLHRWSFKRVDIGSILWIGNLRLTTLWESSELAGVVGWCFRIGVF